MQKHFPLQSDEGCGDDSNEIQINPYVFETNGALFHGLQQIEYPEDRIQAGSFSPMIFNLLPVSIVLPISEAGMKQSTLRK
jgi:hypothetical protein